MSTKLEAIKPGDSISLVGTVLLPAGAWTATAWLRDKDRNKKATFAVTLEPLDVPTGTATHAYTLDLQDGVTAAFPAPATYTTDVRFARAAPRYVMRSPSVALNMLPADTGEPA